MERDLLLVKKENDATHCRLSFHDSWCLTWYDVLDVRSEEEEGCAHTREEAGDYQRA